MKLSSRDLSPDDVATVSSQVPLVILHGLYGSSRNWSRVGVRLSRATGRRVFALDLRNHGASPWAETMSYAELADDVLEWLDDQELERVVLVGHSLGGKTAMAIACRRPERVESLIVVDIAPKKNRPDPELIEALLAIDLRKERRSEIEDQVRESIPDTATRLFLLTNLIRDPDAGGFRWQANLPVIASSLDRLGDSPIEPTETYHGPTAFLVGGQSGYVLAADHSMILGHFPKARIVTFETSGHNVHVEGGDEFVEEVRRTVVGEIPS